MRISTLHRIASPLVLLTIGALAGTACSDAPQPPTAAIVRPVSALNSRVPSAHGNVIRQRVADKRARHLTADEIARVKSLRGTWQWAADMHHAVMQEAIHDPSLGGLRQQRTPAERCEIALRYLKKHYPEVEARLGKHNSAAERTAAINSLASQVGACPASQSQASIFAVSAPRLAVSTRSVRARTSVIRTASGTINIEQVTNAWRDYVVAMSADIRAAKDLGDATDIMDSYLATASADPDVPQASLALIAGTIDLATSSANEWDTFARPHEGSMFMWGWLSDLGDWVAGVVTGDLNGCIDGVNSGWADAAFAQAAEGLCFGGALFGSIFAAI
jgi:hypothetical protein